MSNEDPIQQFSDLLLKDTEDSDALNNALEILRTLTIDDLIKSQDSLSKIKQLLLSDIPSSIKELITQKFKGLCNADNTEIYWANDDEIQFIVAARSGDMQTVKLLIKKDSVDINARNKYGNTALIFAVRSRHKEIAKLLIESNDISYNHTGEYGYTPLHWALKNNMDDIVRYFIMHNADVNLASTDASTPLHIASKFCDKKICDLLLNSGASKSINAITLNGDSPIDIAIKHSKYEQALEYIYCIDASFKVIMEADLQSLDPQMTQKILTQLCSHLSHNSDEDYHSKLLCIHYIASNIKKLDNDNIRQLIKCTK